MNIPENARVTVSLEAWPDRPCNNQVMTSVNLPRFLNKVSTGRGFFWQYLWNVEVSTQCYAAIKTVPSQILTDHAAFQRVRRIHETFVSVHIAADGDRFALAISREALAAIASLNVDICIRHDLYYMYYNHNYRERIPYKTNTTSPTFPGYYYFCTAFAAGCNLACESAASDWPSWLKVSGKSILRCAEIPGTLLGQRRIRTNRGIDRWMSGLATTLRGYRHINTESIPNDLLIVMRTNCEAGGLCFPRKLLSQIASNGVGLCFTVFLETMDIGVQPPDK